MKYTLKIFVFLSFQSSPFLITAQCDTLIHNYNDTALYNSGRLNGYHFIKKNGVIVKEYKIESRRIFGIVKEYYDNGNLKLLAETLSPFPGTSDYCGLYREFFETGAIKTEGYYKVSDSVKCLGCLDFFDKPVSTARRQPMRTGLWVEFHENGQPKSVGKYNAIHVTNYEYVRKPEKETSGSYFTPGDYSFDFVKDNLWRYYNEKGQLIREEYFYCGFISTITNYEL